MPGDRMMIEVRDLIGKPYAPHGRGPDSFDCYGLGIEACRRFVSSLIDLYSRAISFLSDDELVDDAISAIGAYRIEKPIEGAVVLLRVPAGCHIGVCLGRGDFIHATRDKGVQVETLSSWRKRTEGFYLWP